MKASNIPGDDTSFFFFISLSFGFLLFYVIINFYKNCFIIIIIILFIYFHENVFFFHVPGFSGMFHVPDFIDGRQKQHFARCQFKVCKLQKRAEQFMELFNVFELKILSYYLEFSAPPENFFFLL